NIPQFNEIVKTKQFTFNGYTLTNTNEMLTGYEGADGVKTGYTGLAGRCLVTSATKNNMRLISVVLFCDTRNLRSQSSRSILDFAFDEYGRVKLLDQGKILGSVQVDRSRTAQEVKVAVAEDLKAVLKHNQKDSLYTRVSLPDKVMAPVKNGEVMGTVSIFRGDEIIAEAPLIAVNSAEKKELGDYIKQVLTQWLTLLSH
ncbi:MAG: D-alanyl-D-alanine carboxypeptidase, partial [Clostridia bacterium]|nr:D-alanyl-D-alanine carboxypeptidase [Clostridia bacterium]